MKNKEFFIRYLIPLSGEDLPKGVIPNLLTRLAGFHCLNLPKFKDKLLITEI